MQPEARKLLLDMAKAGGRIARFTKGKTFQDYASADLLRSGVERQFEILGEAITRLVKLDKATAELLSNYRKIAGFRNALIHGYDSINDEISWAVVQDHLPILRRELRTLLDPTSSEGTLWE